MDSPAFDSSASDVGSPIPARSLALLHLVEQLLLVEEVVLLVDVTDTRRRTVQGYVRRHFRAIRRADGPVVISVKVLRRVAGSAARAPLRSHAAPAAVDAAAAAPAAADAAAAAAAAAADAAAAGVSFVAALSLLLLLLLLLFVVVFSRVLGAGSCALRISSICSPTLRRFALRCIHIHTRTW